MWADPTIKVDLSFVKLVPALQQTSVFSLSISGKQLNFLKRTAIQRFDIHALIGATVIYMYKNSKPDICIDFPINHIENFDTMFYLVSQRIIKDKLQNQFFIYVNLIIQRWIKDFDLAFLSKILDNLRSQIFTFEKFILVANQTDKNHKIQMIFSLMRVFLVQNTTKKQTKKQAKKQSNFTEVFRQHAQFIMKNKLELFLLVLTYEIQYLIVKNLNKGFNFIAEYQPMVRYFEKRLFHFTNLTKLSVSIESISFLMRKYYVLQSCHSASHDNKTFLYQIEEIIDKNHFNRINLQEKTQFYYYHMKKNSFFYYLDRIFDKSNQKQYKIIQKWRQSLKMALKDSIQSKNKNINENNQYDFIQETIFYMQLRKKERFLFGNLKQVNQFPLIHDKVIKRNLMSPLLSQFTSLQAFIVEVIAKVDTDGIQGLISMFIKMNQIQQAIFFYYLTYFQMHKYTFRQIECSQQAEAIIRSFKHNIGNKTLLSLLEFYLVEIQLGNIYGLQIQSNNPSNTVNTTLYQTFIQMLVFRLDNAITQYKLIDQTNYLYEIQQMNKYMFFLYNCLYDGQNVQFICKNCKLINDRQICNMCQHICIGIKLLYNMKQRDNLALDKTYYVKMFNKYLQKCQQIKKILNMEMFNSEAIWISMLFYLFQKLSIIYY